MMEKAKSLLLFLLVGGSLVQSYFLAYSMPNMEAKVKTELDYVKTEPLGTEQTIDQLIFPEQMIIHRGFNKHTVFYPSTNTYYDLILSKLQGRDFKGFERDSIESVDWNQVRRDDEGVELRFGRAVPFELLQRVFKIDSDFLFKRDSIDRIWIYANKGPESVRTFFFSADGRNVYEALRADLTVGDVSGIVGFGQFWDPYTTYDGEIYMPEQPYTRLYEMEVGISRYTAVQMQENLFFDPSITKTIQEKEGPQFYTDTKRGLKVDNGNGWMTYTDPVAPTDSENDFTDNAMSAISFVNEHGGWNGRHALVQETETENTSAIRFQQYYNDVPVVSGKAINYGYMQLLLKQGIVSSYERSLILLGEEMENKSTRQLPGGDQLRNLLNKAEASGMRIESLFPAYRPTLNKDSIVLRPVWAVRQENGEVEVLAESGPVTARP